MAYYHLMEGGETPVSQPISAYQIRLSGWTSGTEGKEVGQTLTGSRAWCDRVGGLLRPGLQIHVFGPVNLVVYVEMFPRVGGDFVLTGMEQNFLILRPP